MVYGRLDPRVLGCEALVSVGHHLLLLVAGPGVENVPHVQVVGVVRPAVPGQLHHVLSLEVILLIGHNSSVHLNKTHLEVDHLVNIFQRQVPLYPLLPVGLHCGLVRQWEFSLDVLDDPEGADVEHGVGVGLVLDPAVQQLVVSALLPDQALEQTGGVEDVTGLQSQVLPDDGGFYTFHTDLVSLPEEIIFVKVASAHQDHIHLR